jgi:hypothetical protein
MDKKITDAAEAYKKANETLKTAKKAADAAKEILIAYAKSHPKEFDKDEHLVFPNGIYAGVKGGGDAIVADAKMKEALLKETGDTYTKSVLDEDKLVIAASKTRSVRKLLEKLGIKIEKKETWALYQTK